MTETEDLEVTELNESCEQDQVDSTKPEEDGDVPTNCPQTDEKVHTEISIEETPSNLNEIEDEKNTDPNEENKSMLSAWSASNWNDNYESIEDEKPIEDCKGDPKKLVLWASEKNELETLRCLLEEDSSLINTRDNDLYTPLHRASYSNHTEVIKVLLSFDADITARTSDGWEPLHCACKWDSVEAVSLLLQNGANVNAVTEGGLTPLHLAASNASGRRTLEHLLWHPHIDPTLVNKAGDTAYDIALRSGRLGALFEILEVSINEY